MRVGVSFVFVANSVAGGINTMWSVLGEERTFHSSSNEGLSN